MKMIPFNRPFVAGKEVAYIRECLAAGHSAGDGPFTKRCQQLLETLCGSRKALLTTSCTTALELAALLLDIRPGDEVIAPSFTFPSTGTYASSHSERGTPAWRRIRDKSPIPMSLP